MSRSRVENQNHTERKRAVSSTYKAKQTVWHLSLGRRADGSFGFSVFLPDAFNASYSVFYCHSCFLLLSSMVGVHISIMSPEQSRPPHPPQWYSNSIAISNVKRYCHNGQFLQIPKWPRPHTLKNSSLSLSGWANTDITTIRGVVFKTPLPLRRNSIYCLMWTDRLSSKAAKYFV